jgi:hypothetical protein
MPRKKWPSKYGIDAAVPSALVAQMLEPLTPPFRWSDHPPSTGALADSPQWPSAQSLDRQEI